MKMQGLVKDCFLRVYIYNCTQNNHEINAVFLDFNWSYFCLLLFPCFLHQISKSCYFAPPLASTPVIHPHVTACELHLLITRTTFEAALFLCQRFLYALFLLYLDLPCKNVCQQVQEVQGGESWRWKIFSTDPSAMTALLSWIENCPIKLD